MLRFPLSRNQKPKKSDEVKKLLKEVFFCFELEILCVRWTLMVLSRDFLNCSYSLLPKGNRFISFALLFYSVVERLFAQCVVIACSNMKTKYKLINITCFNVVNAYVLWWIDASFIPLGAAGRKAECKVFFIASPIVVRLLWSLAVWRRWRV